jgi:SAM-dependent methyltransferase
VAETFARYDTRGYRTVDVAEGYAAWAPFYDATMDDRLDLPLLSSLNSMDWNGKAAAVDLGCGTGRVGAWLKAHGVACVDGVDSSAAMLERASAKGIYHDVVCADVTATGLAAGRYDPAISSFVACHIADLSGFYAEAARLIRPGGRVILIDYHPSMLLKGVLTHFDGPAGEPIAIVNFIHLLSDHVEAGRRARLSLLELRERLVDAEWVRQNPRMASHAGQPVAFAMVWVRQ